jgi:predicted Zn-dependent protease
MAVSKLRELSRRYPQNIIFKYNLARLLEKCDQPSEAKARYQEVLALKNNELQTLREKSRLRLQKL